MKLISITQLVLSAIIVLCVSISTISTFIRAERFESYLVCFGLLFLLSVLILVVSIRELKEEYKSNK